MILRLSSLKQQRHLLSFMILCVGCDQTGHFFYPWHLLEVPSHRCSTEWQHLRRFILLQAVDTGWYVGIPLKLLLLHKVSLRDQSFLQHGGLVTKGECSRNTKVEAPDLLNSSNGPYTASLFIFYSSVVKAGHKTNPNPRGKKTDFIFQLVQYHRIVSHPHSINNVLLCLYLFSCLYPNVTSSEMPVLALHPKHFLFS